MQWNVTPELERLIHRRLSTGIYANADEVVRHALEAQEVEKNWTNEERLSVSVHIEEGYKQAERGDLMDPTEARRDIVTMKDTWRISEAESRINPAPAPQPSQSKSR